LSRQHIGKRKQSDELNISAIVDITERKRDEEYVGHLAAIVESSDDAIISKSLDGIIKSWNKGGEKMFGYTAEQAIGKHISLIIPPEYTNEEKKIVERIHNNEIIDHYETVRNNKNGEQLNVSLTVSPLKDRAGSIIGISKIARDITSQKKSEAELIRVNKELVFQNEEKEKRAAKLIIANKELAYQNQEKEKRAAELIIANKELAYQNQEKENRAAELSIANKELVFQNEEKEKRTAELTIANKELEQLTYIASHDLQEPLRTISNYMQVFEEDYLERLDDNARNYILSVNNAARRMSILVGALLDFSRLGRKKKLAFVDCKKTIANVIADLQSLINKTNATIDVGEMPELNIYEIETGQLFQNLIANAIKFQKKGVPPQIQIRSKKINEKWQFSVSDNGIGIAPAHYERIFDIFQRLHNNDEYEGNGIGLANCKKIVELHHGKIWIESTLGNGTTFNFTIPQLSL
jgi:PAS domain S-box-containing protein